MYLRWARAPPVQDRGRRLHRGRAGRASRARPSTVDGRFAYGWLRPERGVHRLVRISPYDAQKRRQTTFALVEVMPEADDDVEIELNWDEIRVDTFRSSGAGGQHVQKTNRRSGSPTCRPASSSPARTSARRPRTARSRSASSSRGCSSCELEKREEELRKLRGEHVEAGWGNQIRSYVLHPYQMVKDLRTGVRDLEHGRGPRRRPRRCSCRRSWSASPPAGRRAPTTRTTDRWP